MRDTGYAVWTPHCSAWGAFVWLVSLLLSSLVWFVAVQIGGSHASVWKNVLIFGVVFSVLLQELFRFTFGRLLNLLCSFSLGLLGLLMLSTEVDETLGQTAAANTLHITGLQTFLCPHCQGSIVPSFITLILMGTTFFTADGSLQNLKRCLLCRDSDFLLARQHPR
ncbi:LOW QUALITY PROTEIN: gamma-secretase subunit APH-1B [Phoenicopterus ruber ruber]